MVAKPIRCGNTIDKIADCAEDGNGFFVLSHIAHVGKKTYENTRYGKQYDIVRRLIAPYSGQGKTVVMDSGFPTKVLLDHARSQWETRIVATAGLLVFSDCRDFDELGANLSKRWRAF